MPDKIGAVPTASEYINAAVTQVFQAGRRDVYLISVQIALAVAEALDKATIPYVPAVGAMSVWVDLRAALAEKTWESERKVWNDLVDGHKVVLTPGAHHDAV